MGRMGTMMLVCDAEAGVCSPGRMEKRDAVVLGAGQAGKPLAVALAGAGWSVVLLERRHIGGVCVNEGCTPTKTMAAVARVAHVVRESARYGVEADTLPPQAEIAIDMAAVRGRTQEVVTAFRRGGEKQVARAEGVRLVRAQGRFVPGPGLVVEAEYPDGASERFETAHVFVNVDCRPFVPDLPGLTSTPYLNSSSIMQLEEVPDHLVVLGGGYVAVEFGQMFRRFGSRVTLIQRSERILSREDADVSLELAGILGEEGVTVHTGCSVTGVRARSGGGVEVSVSRGDDREVVRGSHLLVALGRIPNTENLGLEHTSIETDHRGFVKVNERLETSVPGVYALGDVNGGPQFTHVSYDDFRVVRANLLEGREASVKERVVPYTVFTDPQLGRVGMTEEAARAEYGAEGILVAKLPMRHVARAIETGETAGFMKAVVDAGTGRILGAAILGAEGGEVMSVLQMAMMGGVTYPAIRDGVFAHPTFTESLNNLFMTLPS